MKKILLSLGMMVFVVAVVVGATGAFFTDTETSTGNVFTAGSIDLKVDSDCHYYQDNGEGYEDVGCGENGDTGVGVGQWTETDLKDGVHKFFSFFDLKPGDWGEDTISLHVYDNDAWGRVIFGMTENNDNGCTEPESDVDNTCDDVDNNNDPLENQGELLSAMGPHFKMWLDQGSILGFQNVKPDGNGGYVNDPSIDPTEGDNEWQSGEPYVNLDEDIDLSDVLSYAWAGGDSVQGCSDVSEDGHNDYDTCHGIAQDGRLVGSTTYYFGFGWTLPLETGNEVQTDSLGGDIGFEIEQHRNNPVPTWNQ